MPQCRGQGRRAAIESREPQPFHQRGAREATDLIACLPQQAPQHPAPRDGSVYVHRSEPPP